MRWLISVLLGAALAAGPALARAPEPREAVAIDRFMGRWYEILRTPNSHQRDCFGASQVWSQPEEGRFSILQQCHRGSPNGPVRRVETRARSLNPGVNTKWEASFFGGLIRRQYWVLDRADDYRWMIASTSGGDYVSVLAREPSLPAAQTQALLNRISDMGLDVDKLQSAP